MPPSDRDLRLPALRRFAVAITVLNLLGHTVLGFEPSWACPLVALATAYGLEIFLEVLDARLNRRPLRVGPGWRGWVDFLLSAHISGLAVAMLLYANEQLLPIAFATAAAIGSKAIVRVPTAAGSRHVFNPSNVGISLTLLLFPWVGVAPAYHFAADTSGAIDWILPGLAAASGAVLNWRFTNRLPLVAAWLCGFVAQAVVRSAVLGTPLSAPLFAMTGLAFPLYTFYMVTDPATTPSGVRGQVVFGLAIALVYGVLVGRHVVFGLFFALTIVAAVRGVGLWAVSLGDRPGSRLAHAPAVARAADP